MIKKSTNFKCLSYALSMMAICTLPCIANAVVGDSSAQSTNIIHTSPLFSDSGQSYHACNVVNITTANLTLKIDLINTAGTVLATTGTTAITLNAGQIYELANSTTYSGFARCRISTINPENIRANLTVFHWTGTYYESLAVSEAR